MDELERLIDMPVIMFKKAVASKILGDAVQYERYLDRMDDAKQNLLKYIEDNYISKH